MIWKFHKFGLKCIFKFFLSSKLYFLSPRPPKGTSLRRNTRFWALIGRDRSYGVIWTGREEYKKRTKSKPKFAIFGDPLTSSHINQILHAGSYPGYLSWFWVSERSVEKSGSNGGRIFGFPIDLAHRLYNSLLLSHKTWPITCTFIGASSAGIFQLCRRPAALIFRQTVQRDS